jgi:hypothetical protein
MTQDEPLPFNRISFLTLNQIRLFTAYDVCDIFEHYSRIGRDALLKELRLRIVNADTDGTCPYDSMNEGTCHQYDDCKICVFDHEVAHLKKVDE